MKEPEYHQRKMRCLNVGCGNQPIKKECWTNIDVNPIDKSIKYGDIRHIPFAKNSFDYVYCHHVLEHVPTELYKIMEELYRVLKHNGVLEIHVPHFMFHGAICHPEHIKLFDFHTFEHFTSAVLDDKNANLTNTPKCRFEITHKEYRYRETDHTNTKAPVLSRPFIWVINKMANTFPSSFDRYWGYWVGGCEEIIVKMKALKNNNQM